MPKHRYIGERLGELGMPWLPGMLVRCEALEIGNGPVRLIDKEHAEKWSKALGTGMFEDAYPDMDDLATLACAEEWMVDLWRGIGGTVLITRHSRDTHTVRVSWPGSDQRVHNRQFEQARHENLLGAIEEVFRVRDEQAREAISRRSGGGREGEDEMKCPSCGSGNIRAGGDRGWGSRECECLACSYWFRVRDEQAQ